MVKYDALIVGAGLSGTTAARVLAENGSRVLLLEKRTHIGGNAYDCLNNYGILIQKYGPHIFHTNSKRVYDFLSRFTQWRNYEHRVAAMVDEMYIPVPFNFTSLFMTFGKEDGAKIAQKLTTAYPGRESVTVFELLAHQESDIRKIAEYVYKTIFEKYTRKQWGKYSEDVLSVTARVPVVLSHDDRYFHDRYQGIPLYGFTNMIGNMLEHENIDVSLGHTATADIVLNFSGTVIYTGALDELFNFEFGALPYRTLDFEFETLPVSQFQPYATVNYTQSEDFTRITEFRHLTGQSAEITTILKEYPRDAKKGDIPCYSVNNAAIDALYGKYLAAAQKFPNLHLLGRLAEYKYYNMDAVCERALLLGGRLIGVKD
ncbi:MAG: UDP-galactopyranose mutase [Clostridia bacterium]|nr:UDP-galactopyranose mutase [Clostridia bacterium]